jgi:hypothetical protein
MDTENFASLSPNVSCRQQFSVWKLFELNAVQPRDVAEQIFYRRKGQHGEGTTQCFPQFRFATLPLPSVPKGLAAMLLNLVCQKGEKSCRWHYALELFTNFDC